MTDDRAELRKRLRAARRAIDPETQRRAAADVARAIGSLLPASFPHVVAGYLATDGELDPMPSLRLVEAAGGTIALPRIDGDTMTFHTCEPSDLVAGPVGLTQPRADTATIDPRDLALVLCPLVGFDRDRNRLGRGRAYYDRAFAFLGAGGPRPATPLLIGIAHDVQAVDLLPIAPHDVGLDLVVTPTRISGDVRAALAAVV